MKKDTYVQYVEVHFLSGNDIIKFESNKPITRNDVEDALEGFLIFKNHTEFRFIPVPMTIIIPNKID